MDYSFESLKKNYTNINEPAKKFLKISRDEYGLCAYVQYRSADPRQKIRGWCCDSKQEIAEWVGISRAGLYKMIDRLSGQSLLETDAKGNLSVTAFWVDTDNECKLSLQNTENKKTGSVNLVDSECKLSLQKNGESVNLVTHNIELDISKSKKEILSGKPDDTEILPLEEKKKKEKVHPAAALEKKIEALREKLKTASDQERVKIIKEGKSLKAQLETEAQIDAVILRLNEKAGFRYELTAKEARRVIGKRLSENTIEEIFQVVDFKIKEWNGTEWHKYLRPETLLNGHFEGYYQASLLPKSKPTTQPVYEKPKKYLSEIDGIIFHK
jgi:uncharacterized phage protein (TIGR02220 family)